MSSGGNTYYYHYDVLGSVGNVSSASGVTEWTESYDPYGATRAETKNDPSAASNPMKFAGEYEDATGLYYLRARQYDAATGFLTLDPVL